MYDYQKQFVFESENKNPMDDTVIYLLNYDKLTDDAKLYLREELLKG